MLEDHLAEALHLLKKQPQHRCKMEIDLLVHLTQELPFFKQYYKQENGLLIHRECCKHMFVERFLATDIVFHVDSIGTKFYVILDGQVEVLIKRRGFDELESVRILRQGESFGELALIHRQPRLATIRCVNDCCFAVLDKQQFQQILHYEQTKKIEQNVDYFAQISIFNQLNRAQLTQIYLNSFLYEYEKHQTVLQEGDKSDSFLIVKAGLFQVRKLVNKQHPLILFEIGELQVFGFYHLFNKIPYEYSIICLSPKGQIYKIHRTSLIEKIFEGHTQDLEKHKQEINSYVNFKVHQEQNTHLKYPRFFQIKTSCEQDKEIQEECIKTCKNKESKNDNYKSRNQLIKQKMDTMIEQSKRKLGPKSNIPRFNSLFEIFLKSHKGLTENQRQNSPSLLETPTRQIGCSTHFFNNDEQQNNPFITFRSSSPIIMNKGGRQFPILKLSNSQRTIVKSSHHYNSKFQFQDYYNQKQIQIQKGGISLSPDVMKLKVYKY
ncbi:unnamed protein product [Paramecium primaurelia]|uniref:Cyclic nucleotide-binding domain-containing protein n=1 Tax=Paramecium primaurelia TaxID=5886 RepID=A0A8S1PYP9_PARPR|nr:unnamed protein product [Paramecium primaurelia]